MTDLKLNAHFDYETNTTNANLVSLYPLSASLTGANNVGFYIKVHDADGTIIQSFVAYSGSPQTYHSSFIGSGSFGLDFDSYVAGYDTSIQRTDNSGVYVGIWASNWELSEEPTLAAFKGLYATGVEGLLPYYGPLPVASIISSNYLVLDKRDKNKYLNSPLLISGGDAVVYGSVYSVSEGNLVALSQSDYTLSSYTGMNLNNCIGQVISGSNSGEYFGVLGLSGSSSGFYVDKDLTSYSGQRIKIMPYRNVSEYSGWSYDVGGNGYKNGGGILSRFGLSETIPYQVGSLHYTSGTYSGSTLFSHPNQSPPIDIFPGTVVSLKKDPDLREVAVGDLVFYNPSTDVGATYTGVVVRKGDHAVAGEGDYSITYWPAVAPHANSEYTIYRNNDIHLQIFPELDREYLISAQPLFDTVTGEYFTTVKTPSATLEFSANEYPSTFATITETSHFHIGPVYLSNGQMLDDKNLGQLGYVPLLHFSGQVFNGDPVSPTSVLQKQALSTQNPNIAHKYNGTYVKDGIMTMAASTSFNAAETLICKVTVSCGSIKIRRVFTIPVQPTV